VASSLPVPAALTRGITLQVIDYAEQERTATAAADGIATITWDYLQQGQYWRLERLAVVGNHTAECTVGVYQGDTPIAQRQRDGTPLPPGIIGVSEYPSFLTILPTSCLTVVVTGAAPGNVFTCAAQFQLVQKIIGRP